MDKTPSTASDMDAYIAGYPETVQQIMQGIRELIHTAAPECGEKISYGIPTFTLNGRNLVHFGGFTRHVSFFPGSEGVEHFLAELEGYKTSRGTIQFPLDRPIPFPLIRRITEFCVLKNQEYFQAKMKVKKK
jgi:uncharacterized protein YdhG (YjbR/CyaY superfamily)